MAGSDHGFLVSQIGVDFISAADYQLLSSSSWPLLKIESTGVVPITDNSGSSNDLSIVQHNLGYPPFFLTFIDSSPRFAMASGSSGIYNPPEIGVDNNNLLLKNHSTIDAPMRYYIFRLPLNQSFSSSTLARSEISETTTDRDFGIKAVKSGKSIDSTDLRDFTYHSGTRAPMIHNVTYAQLPNSGGSYILEYINNLIYAPIFFVFHSSDNSKFYSLPWGSSVQPRSYTDDASDIFISNSSSTWGSIVVFKDPFYVSNPISVAY